MIIIAAVVGVVAVFLAKRHFRKRPPPQPTSEDLKKREWYEKGRREHIAAMEAKKAAYLENMRLESEFNSVWTPEKTHRILNEKAARRCDFSGASPGATVRGWPSKGGVYARGCCVAELDFLGLDRFTPALRSDDQAEEDAHCERMRKLGATWYPSDDEDTPYGEPCVKFTEAVKAFGWPTSGGVWVLKMAELEADLRGMGRIMNAFTMDERCKEMEKLGATFYANPEDCPDFGE